MKRNAGILPDAAARAKAAASARRSDMTTREVRIDAGRDAGKDAEKEDAAKKEERPGTDDVRVDTRVASALIPPSLNIWVSPDLMRGETLVKMRKKRTRRKKRSARARTTCASTRGSPQP